METAISHPVAVGQWADGIAEAVRLSGRVIAKSRFPATFGPEVEVAEVDLDTTAVIVRGERLT